MLHLRDAVALLLNLIPVVNQHVRLFDAAIIAIALCRLLVPKRLNLQALNMRVSSFAVEAFKPKVCDETLG